MVRLFTLILLFPLLHSCYGLRTVSPGYSGCVVDSETKKPIPQVIVNHMMMGSTGCFEVAEQNRIVNWRKKYWMDLTIIIEKNGYVSDTIFKKAGYGGYPKGLSFDLDTVYLSKDSN